MTCKYFEFDHDFVSNDAGVFPIAVNEHTADYAKDYIKIKNLALKEKQIKQVGKWFDEKIKETFIKINGEYQDCIFTNNWLKK